MLVGILLLATMSASILGVGTGDDTDIGNVPLGDVVARGVSRSNAAGTCAVRGKSFPLLEMLGVFTSRESIRPVLDSIRWRLSSIFRD